MVGKDSDLLTELFGQRFIKLCAVGSHPGNKGLLFVLVLHFYRLKEQVINIIALRLVAMLSGAST